MFPLKNLARKELTNCGLNKISDIYECIFFNEKVFFIFFLFKFQGIW